jgi:hypothetical protein
LLASFGTSSSNDGTAIFGFHPNKKTMGAGAFGGAGLKSLFTHNSFPFMRILMAL